MKKVIIPLVIIGFLVTGLNVIYINRSHKNVEAVAIRKNAIKNNAVEVRRYGLMAYYSLDNLTNEATIIANGTVVSVSGARWNNKENRQPDRLTGSDTIFRDTRLKVDKVFKGDVATGSTLTVRTFGGQTANIKLEDQEQPDINAGEKVVVFLVPDLTIYNKDKANDHYILVGATQGIYKINGDETGNIHEKLKINDFEQKVKGYVSNPKPVKGVISDE